MVQPSPPGAQPPNGQTQTTQQPPLLWEGDRMFNVYIHDYFVKRGFRKAAKELLVEADIGPDPSPPINAPQGFLFEWWSVFWMFFAAKTTGIGPENVMLYFQWMQSNQMERTRANDAARASGLPIINQPLSGHPALQQAIRPAIQRPPQPPSNSVRPPGSSMSNGAVPMPPGQPPTGGQGIQYSMGGIPHGTMPAGRPPSAPAQPQQQLNGVMDPSTPHGHNMSNPQRPPSQQQNNRPVGPHGPLPLQQPSHPQPSHPSAMPHLQAAPRQVSRGQHDVMRPPTQFQSPTMAHAHPQNTPLQGPMTHPHMGMGGPMVMGGPSGQHLPQHMSRPLPPPGSQPNAASPRGPSQTPTQQFAPIMNPGGTMGPPPSQGTGSRAATPSGSMLTHRSPALSTREPPQQSQGSAGPGSDQMVRRFPQQQQSPHSGIPPLSTPLMQPSPQDLASMEQNLSRIPPVFLAQMKQEAGVGERDISSLSFEEKCRLNDVFRRTMQNYNGSITPSAQPRPTNPPTNSNARPGMPQQPMVGMPMGPPPLGLQTRPTGPTQPANPRGQKRRSTTSPADEISADTPKDQSPPDRKRQRHSPQGASSMAESNAIQPPMSSMSGFQPGHSTGFMGPPGHPQHPGLSNGFRTSQMGGPMNPHSGQPMLNMAGISMGGMPPNMGHQMPPGMGHMNPALTNQHLHQIPGAQPPAMQSMHYRQMPPHMKLAGTMGVNSVNPSNANAGAIDGAANRPQQHQNKPNTMMPPPSPAHRPETINTQKTMMPPPSQSGLGNTAANTAGSAKEQTAPSPAGPVTSSPRTRPHSSAGPGGTAHTQQSSQPAGGNSVTPALGAANHVTAQSPAMANRISPSAPMNSLPRPQTSGPDVGGATSATGLQTSITGPLSSSAPPSGNELEQSLFGDFFNGMEDNFGLNADIDTGDFSQWIDMNGSTS